MQCNNCPRQCNSNRSAGEEGWCRLDDGLHVASVCLHHGEEPPLSGERGIVNVFFEHCNMQCIYCQNYDISCNDAPARGMTSYDEVTDRIAELLPHSEGNLGFVSPTHCVPQMKKIIGAVRERGFSPTVVYNSNGYDSVATVRSLEGVVDVWLPDFKYSDDRLAIKYSAAPGYRESALSALREMVRQCGVTLHTNDRGIAVRGVIVRHLVLPGNTANSIGVLRVIAEEISPNIHVSLMSQYYPAGKILKVNPGNTSIPGHEGTNPDPDSSRDHTLSPEPLLRTLTKSEYDSIVDAFNSFGFSHGWLQDFESQTNYRPDFSKDNPFTL